MVRYSVFIVVFQESIEGNFQFFGLMFQRRSDDETVAVSVRVIVGNGDEILFKNRSETCESNFSRVVINGVILVFATFHQNSINKNLFRIRFQGVEGNQGPYRLNGKNGENLLVFFG